MTLVSLASKSREIATSVSGVANSFNGDETRFVVWCEGDPVVPLNIFGASENRSLRVENRTSLEVRGLVPGVVRVRGTYRTSISAMTLSITMCAPGCWGPAVDISSPEALQQSMGAGTIWLLDIGADWRVDAANGGQEDASGLLDLMYAFLRTPNCLAAMVSGVSGRLHAFGFGPLSPRTQGIGYLYDALCPQRRASLVIFTDERMSSRSAMPSNIASFAADDRFRGSFDTFEELPPRDYEPYVMVEPDDDAIRAVLELQVPMTGMERLVERTRVSMG